MKYDLFLSDFDGTLVRGDGTISQKNLSAIAEYRKRGGIFAICTGRMLTSILPRAKEAGISEGLVVAYQGATVCDVGTGKILQNEHFENAAAVRAIRALEEYGVHIHVYTLQDLYSNSDGELLKGYEKTCRVKGRVEPHLSDMVEKNKLDVIKILTIVPEGGARIREELKEKLSDGYYVTASHSDMVEILPDGVNKGRAVKFLSDYYGIPMDKTAAIGDQLNDLPLLLAASGKFVVANGEERLKEIATEVPSFEEDGVAYAIENYAMGVEE